MIYRFATLSPAAPGASGTYYLSEPLFLNEDDDLRQVEIDFRSQVSGAEGIFQASEPFSTDAACKEAVAVKEQDITRAGHAVERVSIYDNEIL